MPETRPHLIGIAVAVACLAGAATPGYGDSPRTMGWVEKVTVLPENLVLTAKLDTGAQTSALDAPRHKRFERDGKPWVRFTVNDRRGRTAVFERPVIRAVRVSRSDTATQTRPVIMLALCLDGMYREEAVTLTNRSHLSTPLLIGRSMMSGRFLVNPWRKNLAKQKCAGG